VSSRERRRRPSPRYRPIPPRRRRRRRTTDRPVSVRIYRAAWAAAAVPLLAAAFSVVRPEPLPQPRLEPSFDQTTAVSLAVDLARVAPDRTPGSAGAEKAADWVEERFADVGLTAQRDPFTADIAPLGETELVNVAAVSPGNTPETIVVLAHRDNSGTSPGANDNASGTGALLELARSVESQQPAHTVVFLSTDGGAFGGAGAARLAENPDVLRRIVGGAASIVGVVNLDGIASGEPPRLLFAGDAPRSPASALVATAEDSVELQAGSPPERPSPFAQLVDLAFPFSLHEQGPFVARGTPAITLTTGGERADPERGDTIEALAPAQLGRLGRSAQDLLLRLDASAELARATESYLAVGDRFIRGWTIQLFLLAALLPFLAATIDLFARMRRRHVPLAPALRSYASRLGIWLFVGALFALMSITGLLANGDARPLNPDLATATEWPLFAIAVLGLGWLAAWLLTRPRLVPRGPVADQYRLAGHLAAMLVLGLVALVVAATNPYSLLFVLPSLHAWLWLPHVPRNLVLVRVSVYAAGFAGALVLVGSFAWRLALGADALPYLLALVSVGYVTPALVVAGLVWIAAAGQVGAVAFGRYRPYPPRAELPVRGPVREGVRRTVLAVRDRRDRPAEDERRLYAVEDADEGEV
jgi:hypothetical protein